MKLGQLTIHDFSAFEDASLEFSPGINVFIGQNATGKSHLLTLLDIADNPILREYARYYEDQRGAFEQPAHSTRPSTGGGAR
jgi:predicted ATP-dependent endonuclease of OLD family